jgi:hypothetical protein
MSETSMQTAGRVVKGGLVVAFVAALAWGIYEHRNDPPPPPPQQSQQQKESPRDNPLPYFLICQNTGSGEYYFVRFKTMQEGSDWGVRHWPFFRCNPDVTEYGYMPSEYGYITNILGRVVHELPAAEYR